MALITTVGATDADSFITLAEWQDYWDLRDVDLNQHGHDAAHEADLRIAAQYITQNYNFVGQRQYQYQALAKAVLMDRLFKASVLSFGHII